MTPFALASKRLLAHLKHIDMAPHVKLKCETWPLKAPFRITGKTITRIDLLIAEIEENGVCGRGEAAGIFYMGESAQTIRAQAQGVAKDIETGATRHDLLALLPRGGARNALDCAMWDLQAKQRGESIWDTLNVEPAPVTTVMTIGIDAPGAMANLARSYSNCPVLKIKLDHEQPVERLSAIRAARPDATLIVDANQGFKADQLKKLIEPFAALGLAMLEQPLARGADDALDTLECPFPLCADESCLDITDLSAVAGRYQMINIKLDKTGGLTHALDLAAAAKAEGLGLMVGNMHGTSLAMAPGFVIAQSCEFVDLDGPLLLANDRPQSLTYCGSDVAWPNESPFWGCPQ